MGRIEKFPIGSLEVDDKSDWILCIAFFADYSLGMLVDSIGNAICFVVAGGVKQSLKTSIGLDLANESSPPTNYYTTFTSISTGYHGKHSQRLPPSALPSTFLATC